MRLGNVIDMLSGFAFKSQDFKKRGHYRLLRGINLGVNEIRWNETVYIDSITDQISQYQIRKGDVLLGMDRPWINNGLRICIYKGDTDTVLVQRVLRLRENNAISKEYLTISLTSSLFSKSVEANMTGISVPHISQKQVENVIIPLPPFAEQKRIVAKLDELLPQIDCLK